MFGNLELFPCGVLVKQAVLCVMCSVFLKLSILTPYKYEMSKQTSNLSNCYCVYFEYYDFSG